MRFTRTRLQGAYIIDSDVHQDERGGFFRTFCRDEFVREGLPVHFVQANISSNLRRGTLRGMHFQDDPHPEGKLVRCTCGAIYDVIVDLRPHSVTYRDWISVELSEENARAIYVPVGFAHGFQTLRDSTQVLYHMTEIYHADLARGVRWNDPAFGITWPLPDPVMSTRDATFPDFAPHARHLTDQGA